MGGRGLVTLVFSQRKVGRQAADRQIRHSAVWRDRNVVRRDGALVCCHRRCLGVRRVGRFYRPRVRNGGHRRIRTCGRIGDQRAGIGIARELEILSQILEHEHDGCDRNLSFQPVDRTAVSRRRRPTEFRRIADLDRAVIAGISGNPVRDGSKLPSSARIDHQRARSRDDTGGVSHSTAPVDGHIRRFAAVWI